MIPKIMTVNIIEIGGSWDYGYVLDQHTLSSNLVGTYEDGRPKFDTVRTELGEAVFQLKYRANFSLIQNIGATVKHHLQHQLRTVDYVIAMPPSKARDRQPVPEIAQEIAKCLGKEYLDGVLLKVGSTPQMKDFPDKASKKEALLDCFEFEDIFEDEVNLLLVDDLYSSGASLESACDVLRQCPNVCEIFVVALTRTK